MKILISHIEYLLTENDCVIVPGWGGFVVQEHHALFVGTGILPPFREICFNPGLVHDDGILISSISQTKGISYAEARRLLNNELEIFKGNLSHQNKIIFGEIGHFSLDSEQTLIFESQDSRISRFDSFGFAPLQMKTLDEIQGIPEPAATKPFAQNEGDIIHIRFSKRKMLRAVASSAVILILWIFSTPVGDQRSNASCAGILTQIEFAQAAKETVRNVALSSIPKADSVISPQSKTVVAKKDTVVEKERYFIVLGSFQTEKAAIRHKEQLTSEGIADVKVRKMGTKMRSYLKGFTEKDTAMKYLNHIRKDREEYNEAWLYCMK